MGEEVKNMKRDGLIQAAALLPLGAAAAIIAWQAQGDGFTPGGLIAAGVLCFAAYALVELPYYLPAKGHKKSPHSCGNTNRGIPQHKTRYEDHYHHNRKVRI